MPVAAREVRRALERRFGFTKTEDGNHEKYRLEVGGKDVAHTQMSRGSGDLGDPLVGAMARQLGVSKDQLLEMIDCRIDRDRYLRLLG